METLPRYSARRVRRDRKMLYEVEGHCYPGVTTVLSATKPAAAREALWRWRQSVGAEEARRISGKASSAGTRLHQQIAAYLNQAPVDIPDDIVGYWRSIAPVLERVEGVLLVEGAVWHPLGFVGFPDALVCFDGALCLCDWKTARKPKRADWIEDYFLQVAAYQAAASEVYAEFGVEVKQGLVAIALDHEPAQIFQLDSVAMAQHWQGFQRRLHQYQRTQAFRLRK